MATTTAEGWSASAQTYAQAAQQFTALFAAKAVARLVADLEVRFRDADKMTIIDIACGSGAAAIALAKSVADEVPLTIHATDFAQGMLDALSTNIENLKGADVTSYSRCHQRIVPHKDDMQDLSHYADNSMDGVLCIFGIMFPPDAAKAAAEIRRILKPNATAYIATWHYNTLIGASCEIGHVQGIDVSPMVAPILKFGQVPVLLNLFRDAGFGLKSDAFDFVFDGGVNVPHDFMLGGLTTNPVMKDLGNWNIDAARTFLETTYGDGVPLEGIAVITKLTK
jgi:SAM-dependent methyltransferase